MQRHILGTTVFNKILISQNGDYNMILVFCEKYLWLGILSCFARPN
jgi:hypothetical protein